MQDLANTQDFTQDQQTTQAKDTAECYCDIYFILTTGSKNNWSLGCSHECLDGS